MNGWLFMIWNKFNFIEKYFLNIKFFWVCGLMFGLENGIIILLGIYSIVYGIVWFCGKVVIWVI